MRIERAKLRRIDVSVLEEENEIETLLKKTNDFSLAQTVYADSGCVVRARIASNVLVTAGASGECRVWGMKLQPISTLSGHLNRVNDIRFSPYFGETENPLSFASCSSDNTIRLWNLQTSSSLGILKGHENRVNRLLFHPSGNLLISTSHDCTWRMWDLAKEREILAQTGHGGGVYTQSLHPDGSLLFTGDLTGVGMIWDLRIGRAILPLLGHVKQVLSSDFHLNGYHLATGSDDNTIRIWDLRRKAVLKVIPAHTKLVSDIKYEPNNNAFLLSCSFDASVRIWSTIDYTLSSTIDLNTSKVTSVDISNDLSCLITSTQDRKLSLYELQTKCPNEMELE